MEDVFKHPAMVIAALVIAIISGIANLKFSTDPAARPDPFTGTEGRLLELRMDRQDRRLNELTETIDDFVGEMRQEHPEQGRKLDRLIREVERIDATHDQPTGQK